MALALVLQERPGKVEIVINECIHSMHGMEIHYHDYKCTPKD